ncbi:MAG: carboxy terminal-processing peptidase [Chitinophagaceae bacterium]
MTSKKALVWWVPSVLILSFIALKSFGFKSEPASKYEKIITTVADLLEQGHFSPKKIDDIFSKEVFTKYLNDVDPNKELFLQSDMNELKKYETKIDDELHGSKLQFVSAVNTIYAKRILEAAAIYKDVLSKPFDFTKEEIANLNGDKLPYPATEDQRRENIRKRLKYLTLERYADALDQQEKNKEKKDFVWKADSTLERESRDKVVKVMDKTFDKLRTKFTEEEKFNLYINTIASTMDPHTAFFPPVEKRAFDEGLSGRFYGIGALLGEKDGIISIVSVVTGSPAWKSGQIQPNDIILKVAEGAAEPVDIGGYETTDAVKLIRGKKGTEVKLTMKKVDGSVKVVSIIRDEIVQEESYARSAVVNEGGSKIGYIYLPEFYVDFERNGGPSCARDVAIEVQKLKDAKVDGIVMDLRGNPGGSLPDVVKMVGLFVEDGPIVQVKDKDGQPSVLKDTDKGVLWDGPLAVMINEGSASASEIFAAAIQDYKRGIIIGTPSYGKGTVQRSVGIDKNIGFFVPSTELGSMHLTIQKFYRISGGSTQMKGVTPDIILPDVYEFTKFGEKDNPDALPWDEIAKASYKTSTTASDLSLVEKSGVQRVKNNISFELIHNNAEWLAKQNDKEYSLNLHKYQDEQKIIRATVKQIETLTNLQDGGLDISFLVQDAEKISKMDKDKADRYKAWLKGLKKDIYLDETLKAVNDMVSQEHTVQK